MEAAVEAVARSNISRTERIRSCASSECASGCNGTWLTMAKQVLRNNEIHEILFAAALRELLEKGREKHRNVKLIGPRDCTKTFLLYPLRNVFRAFTNPAYDKYAWVETVENEVIFLNDLDD